MEIQNVYYNQNLQNRVRYRFLWKNIDKLIGGNKLGFNFTVY